MDDNLKEIVDILLMEQKASFGSQVLVNLYEVLEKTNSELLSYGDGIKKAIEIVNEHLMF